MNKKERKCINCDNWELIHNYIICDKLDKDITDVDPKRYSCKYFSKKSKEDSNEI